MDLNGVVKGKKIIFFALLAGMLIFLFVALYLTYSHDNFVLYSFSAPLNYVAIFLSLWGIITGKIMFKKGLVKVKKEDNEQLKYQLYSSTYIIQLGLIEGPVLFTIVAFLVMGEIIFLGFTLLLIFYFLTLFPTEENVKKDLGIEEE